MAGNIQYYNLIGGLNTVQGIGTLNQSPKKTESPGMKNVEYYKLGGIVSMNGNTQFGNTLESPISLGYEYIQGNNKYLMVCDTSGKVWEYDRITNQFVNIYTFPTATERHSIAAFNNFSVFVSPFKFGTYSSPINLFITAVGSPLDA